MIYADPHERIKRQERSIESLQAENERLRAILEAKDDLLEANRLRDHSKADRALTKLEKLGAL